MPEKFPNQWSTLAHIWTPQGTKIEFQGPIADEAGELVLAALCNIQPGPKLLEEMRELAQKLLKKKPKRDAPPPSRKTKKPG